MFGSLLRVAHLGGISIVTRTQTLTLKRTQAARGLQVRFQQQVRAPKHAKTHEPDWRSRGIVWTFDVHVDLFHP